MNFVKKSLGRSIFSLENFNSGIIVKSSPDSGGILHQVFRFFMQGSLPFQNECYFYTENIRDSNFIEVAPLIIDVNCGAYYICERLISIDEEIRLDNERELLILVKLLKKIRLLRGHDRFSFLQRIVFNFIEKPIYRTLRELVKVKGLTLSLKFKIFLRICSLELKRLTHKTKIPSGLIHNDFGVNNILKITDSKVKVIDWEDSLHVSCWSLVDITDICFDFKTGTLNEDESRFIISNLVSKEHLKTDLIDLHIEFGVLRCLIRGLTMSRLSKVDKLAIKSSLHDFFQK